MADSTRKWSVPSTLAALVGTAAIFAYYRSATFMGAVFADASTVEGAAGWAVSPLMPLVALALAVAIMACGERPLPTSLSAPPLTVAVGCLGALGVALGLLVRTGLLPWGWTCMAAVLCAVAFVYATILWGAHLCAMGTVRMVGTIVVGYMVAFGVFVVTRQTPAIQTCALLIPLASTLPWLLCPSTPETVPWTRASARATLHSPLLWLLLILLAASSAVRSLVGEGGPPSVFRTWTCAVLSGSLVIAWGVGAALGARNPGNQETLVLRALALCGVLLGVVFLVGVFPYLAQGQETSVYLVASARAAMDALWIVAVCAWVRHNHLPAVPAFLAWGCCAWALQWLECYWALPHLLFGEANVLPQAVVAAAVLLLALALLALCGLLLLPTLRHAPGDTPAETAPQEKAPHRLAELGLTPREAEVALLFSQGFSIGGVAERLGMGKSTAQSHSKAIYRKLGIHTKDELIALVAGEERELGEKA